MRQPNPARSMPTGPMPTGPMPTGPMPTEPNPTAPRSTGPNARGYGTADAWGLVEHGLGLPHGSWRSMVVRLPHGS